MSVDRFSWVPNSYRLHFLLEKQWTTHVPTGPGELVQVWYTNGPMGGPQMPQVKWLWCRETMHSSVLQRGCRFSSERAGFALPGWTWNRDGIVLKVPKHTQKLDTPWYTKNLMHGSSFFQSKMAMFFPCLRQNQMRRCTPLHSVALRRTPSHPVARRRTPSHAVAPRRTPSHPVALCCGTRQHGTHHVLSVHSAVCEGQTHSALAAACWWIFLVGMDLSRQLL